MKAKRLRALLVAGLLSLAPAVTLTSCGGGGGGGGGGVPANKEGLPLSLQGRAVTAHFGNTATARISFIGLAQARVEMTNHANPNNSWTADGTYEWEPGENDERAAALVENLRLQSDIGERGTNQYQVVFSAYSGKLAVVSVSQRMGENGAWRPASSCSLQ